MSLDQVGVVGHFPQEREDREREAGVRAVVRGDVLDQFAVPALLPHVPAVLGAPERPVALAALGVGERVEGVVAPEWGVWGGGGESERSAVPRCSLARSGDEIDLCESEGVISRAAVQMPPQGALLERFRGRLPLLCGGGEAAGLSGEAAAAAAGPLGLHQRLDVG